MTSHQVADDGADVLTATIGRRERYAQADGDNITGAASTEYGDAVNELTGKGLI